MPEEQVYDLAALGNAKGPGGEPAPKKRNPPGISPWRAMPVTRSNRASQYIRGKAAVAQQAT